MSCDRCEECRQKGDRFCRYCGEMIQTYPRSGCDRCEECRENGNRYCRYCGKKLFEEENPFMKIGFAMGLVAACFMVLLLLFEYMVVFWGVPMVLPNIPDYGSTLIIVVPYIIEVVSFNGVLSQIYYILLIVALTACIGIYIFKAIDPVVDLKKGDNKKIRETAFFEVGVLFSVLFIWEMAFFLILEAAGVDMTTLPDKETWIWLYELLEASVWEEVICRLLLIGVPMALIAVFMKHEGKSSWKYLFGGFEMNKTVVVLIFFSAFIFGAGHLNNWGWWKFFPTFAFGLITGYLFSKYGIYATIIMHFMTDYMSAEEWFFGTASPILTTLILLLVSFICIPYTYVYLRKGVLALHHIWGDQSSGLK